MRGRALIGICFWGGVLEGVAEEIGEAGRAMLIGSLLSLALGVLLRLITPGSELTMEVSLRGAPNILDLLIAYLAGDQRVEGQAHTSALHCQSWTPPGWVFLSRNCNPWKT